MVDQDAAQDEVGFVTLNGKEVLIGGRVLIGADSGVQGVMRGLHFGYQQNGNLILYRKTETQLQYLSNGVWTTILSGLTSGTEASFANYSSLAGSFTFFVTVDGYWKINNAFPMNPMNMYNPVVNFHGRILIDKGRTILWARQDPESSDFTAIYGSHQDPQDSPYYLSVQNQPEIMGDGVKKSFSGFIGQLSSNLLQSINNLFGLTVYAPTGPTLTVTGITNAAQAQVTTSGSHGLSANDSVIFGGVKAGTPVTGLGTVAVSGNFEVVGSSTHFTTQLAVGARIYILGTATTYAGGGSLTYPTTLTGIVAEIVDDTHLSVQLPFYLGAGATLISASGASFTFDTMSQLTNVPVQVVSVVDVFNFIVNLNTTSFPVYTSGETVNQAEVLIDNGMGQLTALSGATGTINYITGAFTFNFKNAPANSASVVSNYSFENSNNGGITDFTFSSPRVASEGFIQPQDKGGDPIKNVLVGQDGAYYSLKLERAYKFLMDATDLNPTNEIYYEQMGVPSDNTGVATAGGIVFINTASPSKPEMTVLVKNQVNSTLVPQILFPNFAFVNYDYSDCYFDTYDRFITVTCKTVGSLKNNTILLCNMKDNTVNISPYEARMMAQDNMANLYVGSPLQENVYQIYNGFDDLGNTINAFWTSAAQMYGNLKLRAAKWRFVRELLKKFRYEHIKGYISTSQEVQVWMSFDDAPFQQVGTISGSASYVDQSAGQFIGGNFIGGAEIGGNQAPNVFQYFCPIKLYNIPKFRKRVIKLIPIGIGYFDFNFLSDFDIMLFEDRPPQKYRQVQRVSLDGTQTDLPGPTT